MRTAQLVRRNLTYYWRTNLAVVFGVAIAVAVLAGALLVGDSVRASLRDLILHRLGKTDYVISSNEFFREQLSAELQKDSQFAADGFANTCPLITLEGNVGHASNKRRAAAVRVYGVDERFWEFHGQPQTPLGNREVLVSDSLARELESRNGDSLVIRIEKPSAIPVESLHGRKEDLGVTLRLAINKVLTPAELGEFSLQPQQGPVRALFVPLKLLQRELGQPDKVNSIVISDGRNPNPSQATARVAALNQILKSNATLEDYGIKLRALAAPRSIAVENSLSLERSSALIDDSLADRARTVANDELSMQATPILSYLVNRITSEGKSIPYSLVTAIPDWRFDELKSGNGQTSVANKNVSASPAPRASESGLPPIILNEWAARDLGVTRGSGVSLDYYYWHDDGRLETRTANFYVAAVVPISGFASDRNLVPDYPGISESPSLADWDPPFPVDLKLIRKQDEDYWKQYRTTPKAFIQLSQGQELWQSRFGKLTSLRIDVGFDPLPNEVEPAPPKGGTPNALARFRAALQSKLDPSQRGLTITAARAQGLDASRGATDFGEYFLYFSFFLVVSALLLAALFFKLGIEQRLREIGTLQAIGFSASKIRGLFLTEGMVLSVAGSLLGLVGAVLYGKLILLGLRTWWVDAVGTTLLTLHVSPLSLFVGGAGGVLAALICIVWTLRRLGRASTRSLLSGTQASGLQHPRRFRTDARLLIAIGSTAVAVLLLLAASFHMISQVAGFFGGGGLLLVALLFYQSSWLRKPQRKALNGAGWQAVSRLGFRNTTYRPSRSVLCITLIAFSTFIIVAVDAFRRPDSGASQDKKSGGGGFPLMAESLLPLAHDPNSSEGREALNIGGDTQTASLAQVTLTRFRLRPGDDASCLNLYAPGNPRVLGATEQFINSNRFAFQNSLANTNEEKANPWLVLNRELDQGVVPVIADANSLTYVLHKKLGDELLLTGNEGPVRVRFVGALADSVFQSEVVMSEKNFRQLFPDSPGYRFFLIDAPEREASTITALLEDRLADFGFDAVSTGDRLANFHRVENTYLSTFQMLGGLGLVLGTLGMAAVLLRNVFERRKELALLRAVGYNSTHFATMVFAENALLLFLGLATGAFCALLAIAPVFFERGGRLPNISLGFLLLAVLLSGLIASLVATWAVLRSPLLPALRAE
jgi:ABC-type antimicrobial peptide transport system permease subunit